MEMCEIRQPDAENVALPRVFLVLFVMSILKYTRILLGVYGNGRI